MDYGIFRPTSCAKLFLSHFQLLSAVWIPQPAADYIEAAYRLNELLVSHPAQHILSQKPRVIQPFEAGISDGDLLVVDSSRNADHGDINNCGSEGEFTVKRLQLRRQCS